MFFLPFINVVTYCSQIQKQVFLLIITEFIYIILDASGDNKENITELLVAEGLVELRRSGLRPDE